MRLAAWLVAWLALLAPASARAEQAAESAIGVAPFEVVTPPGEMPPDLAGLLAERLATRSHTRIVGPQELGAAADRRVEVGTVRPSVILRGSPQRGVQGFGFFPSPGSGSHEQLDGLAGHTGAPVTIGSEQELSRLLVAAGRGKRMSRPLVRGTGFGQLAVFFAEVSEGSPDFGLPREGLRVSTSFQA